MSNKCLYCYESLSGEHDYHEKCSKAFFGTAVPPQIPYSFSQMEELAKNVVERSVAVPGVQAKLSMTLIKESRKNTDSRLTVVDALGGNFILKPPTEEFPGMPENEHLSMRIAQAYGLRVVPSGLIRLKSGELAYLSKRIDRTDNGEKVHMLDMFQITEAFDKYKSSMEKIGKALHSYSANTQLDKLYLYELTLFSFLIGNNDMHLKNFSMLKSPKGWELAPAYDLLNVAVLLPEDSEELALTLEGKKKKLRKEHFISFGQKLDLTEKQIDSVFKRMTKNKPKAESWVKKSFMTTKMKTDYLGILNNRYHQIELSQPNTP
jgi:serine/threonine-protein kinase HipA